MPSRALSFVFWFLPAMLVVIVPADADEVHPRLRQFHATGEFDLLVDGVRTDAEILFSRRAAAYLLVPRDGQRMYLLLQRHRSVSTLPAGLIRRENGDVDLPRSAMPERAGRFEFRAGQIVIQASGFRALLAPREPLTGRKTAAEVLAHSPQYGLVMRAFRPKRETLARLRTRVKVQVDVLFGSWCPRCKQTLGNALRVERELQGSGVTFTYYALPKPPAAWKDARFLETRTKALPTAHVYVGGKAVGRVPPAGWSRFDVALDQALAR